LERITNCVVDEEKRAAKLRSAEEKSSAKQEKEAAKQEREAEKAADKRKSKEVPRAAPVVVATNTATNDNEDLYIDPTPATHAAESDPTSPTSPGGSKGLKSIFSKLKRRSKHTSAGTINTADMGTDKEPGFVGGAALRNSTSQPHSTAATTAATSSDDERPHNLGDVEPSSAAVNPTAVPHADELDDSYSDVSSMSNYEEPMTRGRSAERITSTQTATSGGTDFEEAHDHFDEGLAPPPTFTTNADKAKGSPNRDSKFHEVGI
jgi:hypothetical protein